MGNYLKSESRLRFPQMNLALGILNRITLNYPVLASLVILVKTIEISTRQLNPVGQTGE